MFRGLSLDNRVLMVGGGNRVDGSLMSYSDIFEFELETFRYLLSYYQTNCKLVVSSKLVLPCQIPQGIMDMK